MSRHTDFVDEDLTRRTVGVDGMIDPIAARRAAESNLERMSRQRDRLEDQVATTAQELERLRQRRENLEAQKKSLEEIRALQADFLKEKKSIGQRLHQSQVLLEKEEIRTARLTDLYTDSRSIFAGLQDRLEELDENEWEEENFDEDLARAHDQLKGLKMEFNKTLARLDALGWTPEAAAASEAEDEVVDERGFTGWMLVGLAVGLPIALLLGATAILVVYLLTYLQ
ncbi:MAG: hypothetical protein JJU29_02940 [Verrucomicrobia bacterium]|nr:hypothetical protein [Verrucomicrobiota bacterium]MCH8511129.1 hypothetical protein [Kiritimatiellia bacterium]